MQLEEGSRTGGQLRVSYDPHEAELHRSVDEPGTGFVPGALAGELGALKAEVESLRRDLEGLPAAKAHFPSGRTTEIRRARGGGSNFDRFDRPQPLLWLALGKQPMRAVLVGIVLAAVFGIVGVVASLSGPTRYTSNTVMLIDDPYGLATQGSSLWAELTELRLKYADLVSTDAIAGPVAHELHLPVDSILGAASAGAPSTSLLVSIDATWSTPHESQVISQAVANEVTSYVQAEDVTYDIPAPDRFTLTTIDPASDPLAQGPSKAHALTLAIGLAVVGFALGFVATQLVRNLR